MGEEIEVMQPMKPFYTMTVGGMEDGEHNEIQSAPHAAQTVYMHLDYPVADGAMLRRKK